MPDSIRLRFAPSPTGMFHVGSARTALFNWLYVQRFGGKFILRIEDTDNQRNSEEWVGGILEALEWLGLNWDEGPNRQSANIPKHIQAANQLFEQGNAYYCDCTREIIDNRTKNNATPGYDKFCRTRNLGPGEGRALRFRVPEGRTVVNDLVRGVVDFDNSTIEDFVLVRSNGVPMYVHANIVDDIYDRITHVVRGEEHLPNTPKQIMVWHMLEPNSEPPIYAHLPVIVNEARKKLSKRRDKVALEMYRAEGYLPEAMRNYLALLGWAPKGDREIVSLQTLIDEFDFVDVQKSSAYFDVKKLNHFNGEYIRMLTVDEFIERCKSFVSYADREEFLHMAPLIQERVSRLDEVGPMIDFLFLDEVPLDESAKNVLDSTGAQEIIASAIEQYATCDWNVASLHDLTLQIGEKNGLKLGKAQAPIRVAVTGKKVGPPLFESLEVLGREKTIQRLQKLLEVSGSR